MTSDQRKIKRLLIALVYTLPIFLIISVTVLVLYPKPKKILTEKGPDVKALQLVEYKSLASKSNYADLVAHIKNSNNTYGVAEFTYSFDIKDSKTGQITKKRGQSFILPGEDKYVVELEVALNDSSTLQSFTIEPGYSWQEFSKFEVPKLVIRNQQYQQSTQAGNYYTLSATMSNQSGYDLNVVELSAIVKDKKGQITAVNKTNVRTFLNLEQRYFDMIWTNAPAPENIQEIIIYPSTNILKNSEYLKTEGTAEEPL